MAKGIVYVMTTEIDGLVKIGKTDDFESRMKELEKGGYLCIHCQRAFAIEVDNYDEKEKLLHRIFSKGRVKKTEFFAEDINVVKQTMSAFEGKQIFPIGETKEEVFKEATEAVESSVLPDGDYTLFATKTKTKEKCNATMTVYKGKYIVKKGAIVGELTDNSNEKWVSVRKTSKIQNGVLMEDVECSSTSMAAKIVLGHSINGWSKWKDQNGNKIEIYRKKIEVED